MADIPLFSGASAFRDTSPRARIPIESLSQTVNTALNVAQATPSVATSIARGITGGIEAYQTVRGNEAQIAATEARTSILQEQAQALSLENQVNELERDNVIKAARLERQLRLKELEAKNQKLTSQNELTDILESQNPDVLRQSLSPKYQTLGEGTQEVIYNTLSAKGVLSPEEKEIYSNQLAYNKLKAEKSLAFADSQKEFKNSYGYLKDNPTVATLAQKSNVNITDPEELINFANKLSFSQRATGDYEVFIDGNLDNDVRSVDEKTVAQVLQLKNSAQNLGWLQKPQPVFRLESEGGVDVIQPQEQRQGLLGRVGGFLFGNEAPITPPATAFSAPPASQRQAETQAPAPSTPSAPQAVIVNTPDQTVVDPLKQKVLNNIQSSPANKTVYDNARSKFQGRLNDRPAGVGETTRLAEPKKQINLSSQLVDPIAIEKINQEPLLSNQPALIKAIAAVESKGNREAKSPTGVKGLLQVTKATARQYGLDRDIPEENVKAGIKELQRNFKILNDPILAVASYNVGIGAVTDAIRASNSYEWDDIREELKRTLPEGKYKEIKDYPERVMNYFYTFANPENPDDAKILNILRA